MFTKAVGTFWKVMPAVARRWLTRRLHTTFTVSAAGIITNENGEVLLLDHVLRSTVSGWGVPGGFLALGEQPEDALRREIAEETGLKLTDVAIVGCRTIHRHIEVILTAKSTGTAEVKSREITALGWYKPNDLPEEMTPGQKKLIERVLSPS